MGISQIQRKYTRYDTDIRVSFSTPYEFRAEVDFAVDAGKHPKREHKYLGFSKNISIDGLCFESPKELKVGDKLWIELHFPKHTDVIYMEGDVRWSRLVQVVPNEPRVFATGVLVTKVDGVPIDKTIYFDEVYKLMWSQLLERVLGSFAKLNKKRKSVSDDQA